MFLVRNTLLMRVVVIRICSKAAFKLRVKSDIVLFLGNTYCRLRVSSSANSYSFLVVHVQRHRRIKNKK